MEMKRVSSLDLCRVFAAFWVALFHIPAANEIPILREFAGRGPYGVDLFFVLSGYLIADQWLKLNQRSAEPVKKSLAQFYIRRSFRIWPNYFVMLFLTLLLTREFVRTPVPLWKYFFFLQNFDRLTAYTQSWSLCVEEHFYLIFPILSYWIFRLKSSRATTILFVSLFSFGLLLRTLLWIHLRPDEISVVSAANAEYIGYKYFYFPTWVRLDGLTFGVLLASLKRFRLQIWTKMMDQTHALFGLSLAVFLGVIVLGSNTLTHLFPSLIRAAGSSPAYGFLNAIFSPVLISLSFALLIASALSEHSLLRRVRFHGLTELSMLTFSFYLVHPLVFFFVEKFWETEQLPHWPALKVIGELGAALAVSVLLYVAIEKPFLRLRDVKLFTAH